MRKTVESDYGITEEYDYMQVFDLQDSKDRNQYNFLYKSDEHKVVFEEDCDEKLTRVYIMELK